MKSNKNNKVNRRNFLKQVGGVAIGATIAPLLSHSSPQEALAQGGQGQIDNRPLMIFEEISGTVNGDEIAGTSSIIGHPTVQGTVRATLVFSKFPNGFNPLGIGLSCVCNNCTLFSEIEGGAVNFSILTGRKGGYDVVRDIKYPDGNILSYKAQLRFKTPTHAVSQREFSGEYGGPLDIVKGLPYEGIMRSTVPGKVVTEAEPILLRSDGSKVQISWKEEYTFTDPKVTLPFEQIRKFDFHTQLWDPETLTLVLEGRLQTRPRR